MNEKIYSYMNWPRIEAVVYGEETSPRDVMGPKITKDGVLVQGFFPDIRAKWRMRQDILQRCCH